MVASLHGSLTGMDSLAIVSVRTSLQDTEAVADALVAGCLPTSPLAVQQAFEVRSLIGTA